MADADTLPRDRLVSLDAFRGLAMVLMLGEALHFREMASRFPGSDVWQFLGFHQSHVEWAGCSIHDLIQPAFTFMVGVSLPFSIASRTSRGQSLKWLTAHAFWRAAVLVLLGIFLRSLGKNQTYFTFEDTLTQIGLGYGFLFLIGLRPVRDQLIALVLILAGYWGAFALYPLPESGFDWAQAGVTPDWPQHFQGFAAHWNKNTNLAWSFDRWFLNLFAREEPFLFNRGGYATLSFIPTLATMILGLLAGEILRSSGGAGRKFGLLVAAAAGCFVAGLALHYTGVCPIVKRIWTPAWVLFSGGWCFTLLAAFYAVIDGAGWKWWAFPLVVVGMNSIVAYCLEWGAVAFVSDALVRHFGTSPWEVFGVAYEPVVHGAATLLLLWLVLLWMYRRQMFVRI